MHLVECIDLVHIQAVDPMVTDMMMIVMEGRKIEMVMVMEEKKNWAIEMMIVLAAKEIVMVEIMRNVMAGKAIEMMTTGEEVEVLITNMTREAEALIESVIMTMMASTRLGMTLYDMIITNYKLLLSMKAIISLKARLGRARAFICVYCAKSFLFVSLKDTISQSSSINWKV